MKRFFALAVILPFVLIQISRADDPPPAAPDLPNAYQLSNDNNLTTDAHAVVNSSGVASLIYATRIAYANDPYDDFLSYVTFDGLAYGVAMASTTDDFNLALRSPSIVSAYHINPEHPSEPPGVYRHHAAYILNGNCFFVGQLSGAVVFLTSFDGGTTWDMCGPVNHIPGLYNVTSLDMAIDPHYAAPYEKMAVAFARDTDGDGDSDTLYYALNVCDNMACFSSPIVLAQEDPAHPEWDHHFSDVTLRIDAAGNYHVLYLDEFEKESAPLSSRRIMYVSNAVGATPVTVASFPWSSLPGLSRESLLLGAAARRASYTADGIVYIASSADGLVWSEEFSVAGAQSSISGGTSTADVAYVNSNGSVVYVENDGSGWSSPFEVSAGGHSPFMAVNDIRDENGSLVDVARYVFYFKSDPPRTDADEIFARTNQLMQDRIPPYVNLLWPVSGVWTSVNTTIYGQDQEVPRLGQECRINELSYHPCDFAAAGTRLGDLPEYASIPDNGLFSLGIRDHDAAMNYGVDSESGIRKDGRAPDTADDYTALDNLWQPGAQTITLSPNDPGTAPDEASGLDCSLYNWGTDCLTWTKYCLGADCLLDDEHGQTYTDPLEFTAEGSTVFRYATRDVAGNIQTPVIRTVRIDLTDPLVDAGSEVITRMTTSLNATASDTPAGIASWQWTKLSGPGDVTFGSADAEDTSVSMSVDGVYSVRLTVTDWAGRTNADETAVTWDTTSPVINPAGELDVVLEVGSSYLDAGAGVTDNLDDEITSRLVTVNGVNSSILGDYTVTFNVTDHAGNAATQVVRTVHVVDTQSPVINLNGGSPVTLEVGSSYADAGVTVTDNYDSDMAARLVVVNPVNTARVGTYTITYNATDSSGNAADQVTRTVEIVDTTKPVIEILGSVSVVLEKYAIYEEQGAAASDNYDGDLTDAVQITSLVDSSAVGTYTVTYNVIDASGNTADPAVRTVKVVSKGRVEGDLTPLPFISSLSPTKKRYALTTLAGSTVKVRPFGTAYRGKIWARRIDFGTGRGSLYVFAPLGQYPKGSIKVYGADGRLLKTVKPSGRFAASGLNLDILLEQLNDVVYLAAGAKKGGKTGYVYEVNLQGLKLISSFPAGKPAGEVVCRFLQLYPVQSGLVTALNGRQLKVWKYAPDGDRFSADAAFDVSRLKYLRGSIVLR